VNSWHQKTGLNLYSYVARLFHKVTCETVVEHLRQHQELLASMVDRFPFRLPPCVDEDDLCQEIAESLLRALRTYDPTRGDLEKHLQHGVVRHIRQWARRLTPMGPQRGGMMYAVGEAWAVLTQRNERFPSTNELAEETGIPAYRVDRLLEAMETRDVLSIETLAGKVEVPEKGADLFEMTWHKTCLRRLGTALEALSSSERRIITLHYVHGLTIREMAEHLGIPRSTVSRRHQEVLLRLRTLLLDGHPVPPPPAPPPKPRQLAPSPVPWYLEHERKRLGREPPAETWWARVASWTMRTLAGLRRFFGLPTARGAGRGDLPGVLTNC